MRSTKSRTLERLVTEGRIVPPSLDLTELGPPPELPCEMSISEALAAQRGTREPLGSRIAARFAGLGLTQEIPELRGEPARPADYTEERRTLLPDWDAATLVREARKLGEPREPGT